jgi:hypothetical protein
MSPWQQFLNALKNLFSPVETDGNPDGHILRGDGSWPWSAHVDGNDIVVIDCVATEPSTVDFTLRDSVVEPKLTVADRSS